MRFTVFTPTHNTGFLKRLEKSLFLQTFKDFEWLVVPNNGVKIEGLSLPQLRVVEYMGRTFNIGEIKLFCCNQSQGEILVEVDHDDELMPNALEKLNEAFQDDTDFAYSNCCEIRDGKPFTYSEAYGWKYRPFKLNDDVQLEAIAFPPGPASFSKIWYAPNHVRAWRKEFYDKIGGHDPSRDVLDDHDILCRTYIEGNVKHINECLYVYHVHPGNTCKGDRNAFIQSETLRIHDKYIYPLVEKWCNINKLRKIDLGGAFGSPEGYEAVDLKDAPIIANLNERWPFEDGSVGVFRAHDILEHLKDPIHVMKEAYRCLAPNGWFLTFTPSTDGRGAFQDPTHISFWNSNSFFYYTREMQAKFIGTPVRYQLNRVKNFYPNEYCKWHNIVYVKADLLKFDGHVPGAIEI